MVLTTANTAYNRAMQRLPVESTDIVSIGYDPKVRVLEIEFHGGRIYQYRDVEPDVHQHFMRADSHGLFFNSSINGRYRYNRVDQADKQGKNPAAVAFITGNTRKYRDLQQACEPFGIDVEQLELPVDEIQSSDPADIALKKAKQAYKLAGKRPVIAQDAFWNILALRGFPGAYMSEVTQWLSAGDFLKLMEGKTERTIFCKDTLVYYDGKRSKMFAQDYQGTITEEPRGKGHFSIEKIVIMDGQNKTIAEAEDQHGVSPVAGDGSIWNEFAKWYNLQRRLGKA
jgi:XTP/dITP diphosphohydrolase